MIFETQSPRSARPRSSDESAFLLGVGEASLLAAGRAKVVVMSSIFLDCEKLCHSTFLLKQLESQRLRQGLIFWRAADSILISPTAHSHTAAPAVYFQLSASILSLPPQFGTLHIFSLHSLSLTFTLCCSHATRRAPPYVSTYQSWNVTAEACDALPVAGDRIGGTAAVTAVQTAAEAAIRLRSPPNIL